MASDSKACFSSKVGNRAVIQYLYLKGKTGKEIHGELADVYGYGYKITHVSSHSLIRY